jgi:broad-specificity NMP kinase
MYYHLAQVFYDDSDHILVGFHLEESVYAPLYYGYGEPGTRPSLSRTLDQEVMKKAPDTVLVLLKASPRAIAQRMRADPHKRGVLQEKDVEYVLDRFDSEFLESTIRYKFVIDTTDNTEEETFQQFVEKMYPHLGEADRLRIQTKLPPPESE